MILCALWIERAKTETQIKFLGHKLVSHVFHVQMMKVCRSLDVALSSETSHCDLQRVATLGCSYHMLSLPILRLLSFPSILSDVSVFIYALQHLSTMFNFVIFTFFFYASVYLSTYPAAFPSSLFHEAQECNIRKQYDSNMQCFIQCLMRFHQGTGVWGKCLSCRPVRSSNFQAQGTLEDAGHTMCEQQH